MVDGFVAIPVAALLPYVPHLLKVFAAHAKLEKGYDLRDPRGATAAAIDASAAGQYVARCSAAHLNGLESWPQFAIAVLAAHVAGVPRGDVSTASAVYIAARLAYTAIYVGQGRSGKLALARSASWLVGIGACAWLMVKAAAARAAAA
jgi:uncharacterized MAPEG superfamily protein